MPKPMMPRQCGAPPGVVPAQGRVEAPTVRAYGRSMAERGLLVCPVMLLRPNRVRQLDKDACTMHGPHRVDHDRTCSQNMAGHGSIVAARWAAGWVR